MGGNVGNVRLYGSSFCLKNPTTPGIRPSDLIVLYSCDSQCEQQMEIPLEFGEEDSYIFHTYGNTRSRH